MLLSKLSRRRHLDHLGVAQRALRERREPPEGLDLVAEQVDPHRPILRRGKQVQQPAADRELTTILDLVDALVSCRDQVPRGLFEVEQIVCPQHEAVGAERRIGDLLRQPDGADDDNRRRLSRLEQRVERSDPQAHEVRRRRQVRLVRDAATRVVAHDPRLEPRPQRRRQIPGRTVITRNHDRGALRPAVEQRRDEVRPQRLRDERVAPVALERGGLRIVIGMGEERAEHPLLSLGGRYIPAHDALGLVGRPIDERGGLLARLAKTPQHIRRDPVGIGRRRPPDADPHAREVG